MWTTTSGSAPADLRGGVRGDAVDAGGRLVGDERDTGVEEVQALRGGRLGAATRDGGDRLHAHGRHLQRVLLGRGTDDAVLDRLDARAAAVDRDDDRVGDTGCLERGVRTHGRRLVDRVDDVDLRVLGEAVLHRRAAAVLGAVAGLVADDRVVAALAAGVLARRGLVTVLLRVGHVDAHALEEALVPVVVDGDDLVVEQV